MMTYRTYRKNDEQGLAYAFNVAFQQFGFCIHRSAEAWRWLYRQNPQFDPDLVFIAEEGSAIVSFLECMIEDIYFGGKPFRVGTIHDLGTIPSARGKGAMRHLLDCAISELKTRKVDFLLLHSDPRIFPIAFAMYLRRGFRPISRQTSLIGFTNPGYGYGMLRLAGFVSDLKRRMNWKSKSPQYRIVDLTGTPHEEIFREKCNDHLRNHNHFIRLSRERWDWMQHRRPAEKTARIVGLSESKTNELIGGARIAQRYIRKINQPQNELFTIPNGLVDLIVLFDNAEAEDELFSLVMQGIFQTARRMKLPLLSTITEYGSSNMKRLKQVGFYQVASSYCLVAPGNTPLSHLQLRGRPWYIPPEISKGEP